MTTPTIADLNYRHLVDQLARFKPLAAENDAFARREISGADYATWAQAHAGNEFVDFLADVRPSDLDDVIAAAFREENPTLLGAFLLHHLRTRATSQIRRQVWLRLDVLEQEYESRESTASMYGVARVVTGGAL